MRQSVCQSIERPKMNKKSQRSAPVQRSDIQLKNPENPSNTRLYPCRRPPFRAEPMNNTRQHHYPGPTLLSCKCLMCTDQESVVFHRLFCSNRRPLVCTDIDGFSEFFNWLPERSTGPLPWDFLFILGRYIDWHTSDAWC